MVMAPAFTWAVVSLLLLADAGDSTGRVLPPWRDPSLPTATRVNDILSLLTLTEKVSLLQVCN